MKDAIYQECTRNIEEREYQVYVCGCLYYPAVTFNGVDYDEWIDDSRCDHRYSEETHLTAENRVS